MNVMDNVTVKLLDLSVANDYKACQELLEYNFNWLKDDSIKDVESLLREIRYSIEELKNVGFLIKYCNEPYGVLLANFDRHKNAEIHAVSFTKKFVELNTFVNQVIFKNFINCLFETYNANKITASLPAFNVNAETALRYFGFTRSGVSLEEARVNGKPITYINFHLLKSKYSKDGSHKHTAMIKSLLKESKERRIKRNVQKENNTATGLRSSTGSGNT